MSEIPTRWRHTLLSLLRTKSWSQSEFDLLCLLCLCQTVCSVSWSTGLRHYVSNQKGTMCKPFTRLGPQVFALCSSWHTNDSSYSIFLCLCSEYCGHLCSVTKASIICFHTDFKKYSSNVWRLQYQRNLQQTDLVCVHFSGLVAALGCWLGQLFIYPIYSCVRFAWISFKFIIYATDEHKWFIAGRPSFCTCNLRIISHKKSNHIRKQAWS